MFKDVTCLIIQLFCIQMLHRSTRFKTNQTQKVIYFRVIGNPYKRNPHQCRKDQGMQSHSNNQITIADNRN